MRKSRKYTKRRPKSLFQIPSSRKKIIKKYEKELFYDEYPINDQIKRLFNILSPCLNWIYKDSLIDKKEFNSELYICIATLRKKYNPERSSPIPYLERQLSWYIAGLLKKINKEIPEIPCGLLQKDYVYNINYYCWDPIDLLKNLHFLEKHFTRSEKYLIYTILTSDDVELSQERLSEKLGIERKRLKILLEGLKENITMEELYA